MSAWLNIAAGKGAFNVFLLMFLLMFVLMTPVDGWDSVSRDGK